MNKGVLVIIFLTLALIGGVLGRLSDEIVSIIIMTSVVLAYMPDNKND